MEKKFKIADIAAGAGKGAATFLKKTKDNVVKAIDQNDDGAFNMKDVSAIAESIGSSAKAAVSTVRNNADIRAREAELALLRPIFPEELESGSLVLPKLIRIAEIDKKRAESELCQGSIGYTSEYKDVRIVNIFRDKVQNFGLTFYPNIDSDVYYIDPKNSSFYIALDEYFDYLKVARVSELQVIAQDLGAKHFRVTYKEQKSSSTDNFVKAKANLGKLGKAEGERTVTASETSTMEIAAENTFSGHAPKAPKLYYLENETAIKSLISMRLSDSPILNQKFTLKLSNSSGIKEKDAANIDAALKNLKISSSANVTLAAKKEAQRFFEYEVDF